MKLVCRRSLATVSYTHLDVYKRQAPRHALTLAEWSQPIALHSLLATWSDHIYRHQPTLPREQKPLLSLWAQWYIGLLVPPLMLALLNEPQGLSPVSYTHLDVYKRQVV